MSSLWEHGIEQSDDEFVLDIRLPFDYTTYCVKEDCPDIGHQKHGPLVNTDTIKCQQPTDVPSCSSQQNTVAACEIKALTDDKLKLCDLSAKETFCLHQQPDWPVKFNKLRLNNDKSPIDELNEIMKDKKQEVTYNMIRRGDDEQNPAFTFVAKSREIVACGELSSTKKKAKETAANAFLNKLLYNNDDNNSITSTTSNISLSPFDKNNIEKVILGFKPINMLQELCMGYGWELPGYNFLNDEHYSQRFKWYSLCFFREFMCAGEGINKKTAKKKAACVMYEKINKNLRRIMSKDEGDAYPLDAMERMELSLSNFPKTIEMLFNKMKSSKNPTLIRIMKTDYNIEIGTNVIDILNQIGEEDNLSIPYDWVTEKSTDVKSMVHIERIPPF